MLKYLSLTIFITLLSWESASAEWMKVGGTHQYDGFLDMATVAPTGHRVTVWTLKDLKLDRQILSGAYRPTTINKPFDCRAHKSRPLYAKYYVAQMGKGRPLHSVKATREWSRVTPGSDGETELKIACQKL